MNAPKKPKAKKTFPSAEKKSAPGFPDEKNLTSQPSPLPKKVNKKTIILFSLVIFLSLWLARRLNPGSGSFLPFNPQVELNLENRDNWQNYSNKQLNFYLTYPKNWKLTETKANRWAPGKEVLSLTSPQDSNFPRELQGGALSLTVYSTTKSSTSDLIKQALGENGIPNYFENNNLNGVIVFSSASGLPNTRQKILFFENGRYIYQLNQIWNINHSEQEKILSQILQSFNLYKVERTNPNYTNSDSSGSSCSPN